MKFRRVFSIFLVLCMVFSMVPEQVLAAEHVATAAACDHEYEVVEVYEPSCGEEGYTEYECIHCGDYYEDDFVDALEHSYVAIDTYEPSCGEEGYTEYECIHCGDCYEDDFVDALEHSYVAVETYEPSCEEEGYTVYECIYCDDYYEDDFVDALEHSYVLVGTYEPSCEEEGYTEYECIHCGDYYEDDFVDALEHSYVMVGTYEPTCEDEGYTAYECSRCGDYYEDDFVDALGHAYQVTVYEPDCETEGYTEYVCDRCGDAYDDDHKERLGHSYENGNCIRCGKGEDFYIILTWGETPSDLDSHLVYSGVYGHGEVAYDRMEHRGPNGELVADLDEDDTTSYGPETVTVYRFEPGDSFRYYVHDFSNGGDSASEELGQSGATVTVYRGNTLLATYTVPTGIRGYIWEVFSYTSEGLEELEHEYQVTRVEATQCTEVGYYEYSCINCGDYYKVYDEEPLGHDLIHHEAQDATCTEIGWYAYDTCSRCDYTTYVEIPATGHNYEAVVTDPTCTEQGYTTHTCSYCGDSYVDDYTDPVGHSGSMGTYCTVCNEYIPIIGTCGDLFWIIVEDGTMTISGQGAIPDYNTDTNVAPWFTKRTRITAVVIQDGVTGIGNYAFYACLKMESISIPDSVKTIGNGAFEACTKLNSVTIPEGVTSIDNSAFRDCSSLTQIAIPEGVTRIDDFVFSGCSNLTQITIPEGITSIGTAAFEGCGSLTQITIPEGVTSIGYSAFSGCSSLTQITIPEGVTAIGGCVFNGCTNLMQITIPEGIVSIGDCAFSGCRSLTEITIPEGVTSIGDSAFYDCRSLTEIAIPEDVTSIGSGAFWGCWGLTEITIPEGIISIADSVFGDCRNLTQITIPEGIISIGYSAFFSCRNLTQITIPDGVISIGTSAFSNCSSLTEITIPEGVTAIGESAFDSCSSLKEVIFTGDAPTIEADAFSGITLTAYYPVQKATWTEDVRQNYDGTITWVPYIAYGTCGADAQWLLLTDGTLRIWGSGTMVDTYLDEFNVAHTPWYDYKDWITKVKIEEGIENVGNYAFAWCDNLMAIELSSTVSSIGEAAFYDCPSLEAVTIPGNVECIHLNAFANCANLVSVTLQEGVCQIGYNAFNGSSISAIVLPASLMTVTGQSFNCAKLESFQVAEGSEYFCTDENGILYSKDMTILVKVPAMFRGAYTVPEGVEIIGRFAMYGCNYLTDITMSGTLKTIEHSAFKNCGGGNLADFYIPDNVESVEAYAFETGHPINSIVFGSSVNSLAEMGTIGIEWVIFKGNCPDNATNGGAPFNHSWIGKAYYPGNDYSWTTSAKDALVGQDIGCVAEWIPYSTSVIAPTCTEQGYTAYICNEGEFYQDYYVDALGHDLTHHEAQDATCTEIGWYAYDTCSRCDYTTYVEIPATGHSHVPVVTDPTCTEQGYTTHTCSACGDSYIDSYVEPLGHSVENGSCCNCGAVFITITSDLEDTYVNSGKKATVTVEAEGEDLRYAWYYRDGSSGAFKLTTSFTGNSYSVTMNASRSGRQVYCVITDANGFSAQTATVTLGMKATIITQPKSASVKSKETITVSLEAAGDGLTYTWYYSDDGGLSFKKTTSFTGNSYSITMTSARAGRKVYCVVTDKFGNSVTSKTVTLGMRGTAAIRTQPVSVTVASGETAKVAVRASGTGLTYEWYFSDNGGLSFSKTTAFTGNSYSIKMNASRAGRQVYCVVTDKNGNSVKSEVVTLGMTGKAAIRTQPVSVTVANGETAKVAVRASGTGLTYTWFYSDDGGKTFKVTTAFTGSTYSVTMNAKRDGRQVYCVITDANGNKVTTDVVTLNMK